MKSEENEKIEIHIYVKILARTGERSYFYQIFIRRKQAIPLQGSELFYKAEKKYRWRLFELPRYVVNSKRKLKINDECLEACWKKQDQFFPTQTI